MTPKSMLLVGVSAVALSGAVFAFLTNASPYVTVAQAKTSKADNLHLAGDIIPETLQVNALKRTAQFMVKDLNGETMMIVSSDVPTNMGEATKVVAVGGMNGEVFQARKLLLKCPSKYESETKGTEVARN